MKHQIQNDIMKNRPIEVRKTSANEMICRNKTQAPVIYHCNQNINTFGSNQFHFQQPTKLNKGI